MSHRRVLLVQGGRRRRAAELEAVDDEARAEGVSPDEMVRIGKEVGLEPATLHRAMVEVLAGPEEGNVVLRAMGARSARGERLVPESLDRVGPRIDEHLREGEFMVPARRFPGVARYTRDSTFAANPVTSPWMLLGIPLLAGPWYFFQAIYGTVRRRTEERVEALLDSIAHDDPS